MVAGTMERTTQHEAAREAENLHVMPMVRTPMIALAIVALISILSVVSSTVLWNRTITRTAVVDNSIRSLRIVGDLHSDATRLATANGANRREREAQMAIDLQRFEPLVTGAELTAWVDLRKVFARATAAPLDTPERGARLDHLEDSVDRLAAINERAALRAMERIGDTHRSGMIFAVVLGIVAIVVTGGLALVLIRVLRRQRRLIERDLANLHERNRELDAFAARTAHDLRGPLAPIAGYADLVAAGAPVEAARAAMKIRTAATTMSSIIENLLALSAAGHLPLGDADPASVSRAVVDELKAELADAEVVLDLEPGRVACAPNVLGQLLRNLLSNASKYRSPSRRLEVTIEGKVKGRWFELAVADNGVGLANELRAQVFEERFRATSTAARPGHGLGLAIVKRTVDALGGSCALTSEVDVGTRVVLRLPLVVDPPGR